MLFTDGNKYGLVPRVNVDPKRFEVVRIVRIQCKAAWRRYVLKKELIKEQWGKRLRGMPSIKYLHDHPFKFQGDFSGLGLDESVNEVFLWHGCKRAFAMNLIEKKAMFDGKKSSPKK